MVLYILFSFGFSRASDYLFAVLIVYDRLTIISYVVHCFHLLSAKIGSEKLFLVFCMYLLSRSVVSPSCLHQRSEKFFVLIYVFKTSVDTDFLLFKAISQQIKCSHYAILGTFLTSHIDFLYTPPSVAILPQIHEWSNSVEQIFTDKILKIVLYKLLTGYCNVSIVHDLFASNR